MLPQLPRLQRKPVSNMLEHRTVMPEIKSSCCANSPLFGYDTVFTMFVWLDECATLSTDTFAVRVHGRLDGCKGSTRLHDARGPCMESTLVGRSGVTRSRGSQFTSPRAGSTGRESPDELCLPRSFESKRNPPTRNLSTDAATRRPTGHSSISDTLPRGVRPACRPSMRQSSFVSHCSSIQLGVRGASTAAEPVSNVPPDHRKERSIGKRGRDDGQPRRESSLWMWSVSLSNASNGAASRSNNRGTVRWQPRPRSAVRGSVRVASVPAPVSLTCQSASNKAA